MYQPREFRDDDAASAYAHIVRNPMGMIVSHADGRLRATHLPFLVDDLSAPSGLVSHFALRNEQLRDLPDGSDVLVSFPGPHAYVSPDHYVAELDVPTWNYTAVHVGGIYRRMPDAALPGLLTRTVDELELADGGTWSLSSMDAATLRDLARAVVAFEIETVTIDGGYKLSQDKLQEDVDAVIDAFATSSRPQRTAMADEMRRHGVEGRTGEPSTDPATWMDD